MRFQFARLLVLLIIAFLPATSLAYVIQTITEVGNQNLDIWRCRDANFSVDSNILSTSSLAACGGDVGNLHGQGSASATATPGVVRAQATFRFTGGSGTDSRSATSTAEVSDDLAVAFPDNSTHYLVFTVTLGGSATAEGFAGTSPIFSTNAGAGLFFSAGLHARDLIQEGYSVAVGHPSSGSLGTFSTTAEAKSGNTIKTVLRLSTNASVNKGVGFADARFGSSAHLTVAVFTDENLTNQLAPDQFSVIGQTGLDYSTLTVPEPSTVLFLGFGLAFTACGRSFRR